MIPNFIYSVASLIAENGRDPNFNMKVKSGESCGSVDAMNVWSAME